MYCTAIGSVRIMLAMLPYHFVFVFAVVKMPFSGKCSLCLKYTYVSLEISPCKSSSIETAFLIIGINDLVKSHLMKL